MNQVQRHCHFGNIGRPVRIRVTVKVVPWHTLLGYLCTRIYIRYWIYVIPKCASSPTGVLCPVLRSFLPMKGQRRFERSIRLYDTGNYEALDNLIVRANTNSLLCSDGRRWSHFADIAAMVRSTNGCWSWYPFWGQMTNKETATIDRWIPAASAPYAAIITWWSSIVRMQDSILSLEWLRIF